MKVISREEIAPLLSPHSLLPAIEEAFVAYSQGKGNVPPVGEMLMEKGEVHIKYGYIRGGEHYVVKIASGFYQNPQLGLPSSNGLMLLFSLETGEVRCVLNDEGCLTDYRTALAGAVVAKYLAPAKCNTIGIIGTGTQARLQARCVSKIIGCGRINVWGRSAQGLANFTEALADSGLEVTTHSDINKVTQNSQVIITTTPSRVPLLKPEQVNTGSLIIAVGSDTEDKRELNSELVKKAHRVAVDSRSQCRTRGDVSHLIKANLINPDKLLELGEVIKHGPSPATRDEIVVADLTGIALQDLKIAEAIYAQVIKGSETI